LIIIRTIEHVELLFDFSLGTARCNPLATSFSGWGLHTLMLSFIQMEMLYFFLYGQ